MLEMLFANYRELNCIFLFYSNPITLYIGKEGWYETVYITNSRS